MPNNYAIYKDPIAVDAARAQRYRSIVGALNFYSCASRYDIAYPVSRLSQFSCHPTEGAEKALHQVLSYLNCTTDFALFGVGALAATTAAGVTNHHQQSPIEVINSNGDIVSVYSDSDHAGQRAGHSKSQSGCIILLNNSPVYWRISMTPDL